MTGHRGAAAVIATIVSIVSLLFVGCASSGDQGIVDATKDNTGSAVTSPTPSPQYAGSIDYAVGDGSDLWLVTCTESCGGGPPGAGTIQSLSSVGDVVKSGYATPVDAIGALAHDGGDLFALGFSADTVTRLRAGSGEVVWTTDLRGVDTHTADAAFLPERVTVSADSVWVSSDRGGIAQLDRTTGQLLEVLHLLPDATDDVAWSAGSLWVAEALAGLWRLTHRKGRSSPRSG